MFNSLTSLIPTSVLRTIFNNSFNELVKRGDIDLLGQNKIVESNYDSFEIRLHTLKEPPCTSTWAIYKDEMFLTKSDSVYYSSPTEAESAAQNWIKEERLRKYLLRLKERW